MHCRSTHEKLNVAEMNENCLSRLENSAKMASVLQNSIRYISQCFSIMMFSKSWRSFNRELYLQVDNVLCLQLIYKLWRVLTLLGKKHFENIIGKKGKKKKCCNQHTCIFLFPTMFCFPSGKKGTILATLKL